MQHHRAFYGQSHTCFNIELESLTPKKESLIQKTKQTSVSTLTSLREQFKNQWKIPFEVEIFMPFKKGPIFPKN